MITGEQGYEVTRAAAERFRKALRDLEGRHSAPANVDPRLLQAEREAMESRLADLDAEISEYESLEALQRRGVRRSM